MPTRAVRLGIVLTLLAGCGPDDLANQPPALQGLAVSESGPNRFRLVAMANSRDPGVHSLWQTTRGQIDTPDQLQTELTLPGQPGAYPVRLTVQDANGGTAQALVVILHDPNGETELAPATVATFKHDELRTSQTQVIALQRRLATGEPQATPAASGLKLAGVAIGTVDTAISLDAKLQTAAVTGDTLATWSALAGSFDQANGLQARWRPVSPSGLEAVTLTVADGQGHQSQAVIRLLVDRGIPRETSLDLVQVQDGRLVRQAFAAIPTPTGLPVAVASALPTPVATPVVTPSGSSSPSPTPSGSASAAPSGAPTPGYSPSAMPSGSPSASSSPAAYPTMPPSDGPSSSPTPAASGTPTPNPSFTPYNPLATPTPQASPSASPSGGG